MPDTDVMTEVWDTKNHTVGSVDKDGTVWNRLARIVGRVDADYRIWNRSDRIVGLYIQEMREYCIKSC
jgi:hypothetical protein